MRVEDAEGALCKSASMRMAERQVQDCAGWLVVLSDGKNPGAAIGAGRALESIWLGARNAMSRFIR